MPYLDEAYLPRIEEYIRKENKKYDLLNITNKNTACILAIFVVDIGFPFGLFKINNEVHHLREINS